MVAVDTQLVQSQLPVTLVPSPTSGVLERELSGCARVVRDVLVRTLLNQQALLEDGQQPAPPPPYTTKSPALDMLEVVVDATKTGKDIQPHYDTLNRIVANHEERSEIISNLLLARDEERIPLLLRAHQRLEDLLLLAVEQGNLDPTEAMAFFKLMKDEIEGITDRVRGSTVGVKDVMTLLTKIDYTVQSKDKQLAKKFAKTSPQGREIVRRILFKFQRLAK